MLTATEEQVLLEALLQDERERVSPKLEAFRKRARIKGCRGGRGAGAKSWSIASLLLQEANHTRIHLACLREVQLTLEESCWKLIVETIDRLHYTGWNITKESIDKPSTGSHIIFRGISDLRASQIKSLEDFDRFWIEEAQSVSAHSLDILVPTLRKPGSELWFSMNQEEEVDPIIARFWDGRRADAILVDLRPGSEDNPWWTHELQIEMEADFARDPDLAEHVWNGSPRKQGSSCVMSRAAIRAAMSRDLPDDPDGTVQVGVDVARFGDDRSTIFVRRGMKVIEWRKFAGMDTQRVARETWDLLLSVYPEPAGMNEKQRREWENRRIQWAGMVPIKVDDDGVGGGVTDKLVDLGAYVVPVHNGSPAFDDTRFTTCADEQWFGFPIDQADIPDDAELMQELGGRQYRYTPDDRRKIESKADFKKRYGHSPDSADGLLLCFYNPPQGRIAPYSASELGL